MAHTSVAADHFAESDFRVGSVISRSASVLSCRFLTFFIVAVSLLTDGLADLGADDGATDPAQAFIMLGLLSC